MRLPQLKSQSLASFVTSILFLALAVAATCGSAAAKQAAPQLVSSPSELRFGNLDLGQSRALLATVTNNGSTSVSISAISSTNAAFSISKLSFPITLEAGQSLDLNVTFAPSAQGWTGETIVVTSDAYNSTLNINTAGSAVTSVALTSSPSALSFGTVSVGSKATMPVVVTNDRTWDVTVSSASTSTGQFSISAPSLPLTLSGGQSMTVNVTFTPQSPGEVGSSLSVGPTLVVPITGTGGSAAVGQLLLAPAPLNFGDIAVGSTGTQSLSLSATGGSVTVNSASSGSSQFVLEGASFPFTIASGQSLSFNVAFTPTQSGSASSTMTFSSNASDSTATESVSGTGTTPTYSVNLYWNSSSDVSGYNVYRSATSTGTYSKINSSLDSTTAYTDSSVKTGTYYYAATSVNASGTESAKSSPPVVAVIP